MDERLATAASQMLMRLTGKVILCGHTPLRSADTDMHIYMHPQWDVQPHIMQFA